MLFLHDQILNVKIHSHPVQSLHAQKFECVGNLLPWKQVTVAVEVLQHWQDKKGQGLNLVFL